MDNFCYSIPTTVAFGKGEINKLAGYIKEFGDKVLIVYGGGSIKRSGLYDEIINILKSNDISYVELSGVEPNPRVSTVRKGVALCKEHNVDVILPVGGGSSMDCSKAIAAAYYYDGDPWDLVLDNSLITKVLPLVTVSTLSATGSEMDRSAIISNEETKEKMEIFTPLFYPKYSILDPEYTYSVPRYQTASGTADIMSHIFEIYFHDVDETFIQDRLMEALLKTCVKFGPIACKDPNNYEARANLMWASEWAINGLISCGKPGPWPAHSIEHQLSAWYDITHGHGLAIITPVMMKYILNEKTVDKFVSYGTNVFDIDRSKPKMDIALEAIEKTKELFIEMGLSMSLRDIGIEDDSKFDIMAKKAASEGLENCLYPLYEEDVKKIYELSL